MAHDNRLEPLAERVRPLTLDGYIGQDELVGSKQFIRTLLDKKELVSLIFWGPPGCGKTTLARILANNADATCVELSAAIHGTADLRKVIEDAKQRHRYGQKSVLFIDEIHRFNKTQQGALLPHVENGTITLIGATTENPSFEVISPLLSRCRVVVLQALSKDQLVKILKHASKELRFNNFDDTALQLAAEMSGGDARSALNLIEAAALLAKKVTAKTIEKAAQSVHMMYDKSGEEHYNTVSAYIKSLRGSQVDAALYYLGRMLAGGEDPKFIARRMVIFASEDIGEAWHGALTLSLNVFQAVERIGMPEGKYALVHGTVALAKAPKSRKLADSMYAMDRAVKEHGHEPVPLQLRNAPTKLMQDLGYSKDYKWEADFRHAKGFLPDAMQNVHIYTDNPS